MPTTVWNPIFLGLFTGEDGEVRFFAPWLDSSIRVAPESTQLLHRDLCQNFPELKENLPGGERLFWLLEPNLPEAWKQHDWYRHQLAGRPFDQQAVLVRDAVWDAERPLPGTGGFYYWNDFPREEHDFVSEFQNLSPVLHRWPRDTREVLFDNSELLILAHGEPNLLHELPIEVPARVWLLACNPDGILDATARELLTRGARTVVMAKRGKLSAPEIARLVQNRLSPDFRERAQEGVLSILDESVLERSIGLEILGQVELDSCVESRRENGMIWAEAHGKAGKYSNQIEKKTYRDLLAAEQSGGLWAGTVKHLRPQMLYLAERFDHDDMSRRLRAIPDSTSTEILREMAKAMRREGYYDGAASHLARAFCNSDARQHRYKLLTLGVLLFIDLNMPEMAQCWLDESEKCIPVNSRLDEENKHLDWKARIAMRRGKWHTAKRALERKQKNALVKEEDGFRELAGLLSFGSWFHAADKLGSDDVTLLDEWADEVQLALENIDTNQGNDTRAYLCRSLSFYCWATRKPVPARLMAILEGKVDANLADPGPWAQGVLACALAEADVNPDRCQDAFDELDNAHYHLEAAVFAWLLDENERCGNQWKRFNTMREQALKSLAKEGLPACTRRGETDLFSDVRLFNAGLPVEKRVAKLVEAGRIPL